MRTRQPSAAIAAGESVLAALCLSLVSVFMGYVLLEGSVTAGEHLKVALALTSLALLVIFSALFLYSAVELVRIGRRSSWKERPLGIVGRAISARWKEDRLFSLAWPVALFLILLPSFTTFKQRILPKAGFVYDPELAAIDRAIFGTDPGLLLHQLIGSPATTRFFDAVYHSWFLPTTLGICVVALCAGTRTRAQYMLAYALVWIVLGAFFAYLLPAAGPAFYEALVSSEGAAPFRAVHEHLLLGGNPRFLSSLGNQAYLLENLGSSELVIGGGISAIPSIHNALATLFALASFRAGRVPGLAVSAFALLIWIASVYLNWHYAIDGVIGAAGAVLIWLGSGWVVDRTLALAERRSGQRAVSSAAAPA
jgi:hypothetical protein